MDVTETVEEFSLLIIVCAVAIKICRILTHDDITDETLNIFTETLVIVSLIRIQDMNRRCFLLSEDVSR